MFECLVSFSTWLEGNSGQIQIAIALGALYLAYKAYKKVLDQLKIAKKQEDEAFIQRGLELKVQSMNLSLKALELNGIATNNLEELLKLSKFALRSSDESEEVKPKDIEDLIKTINEKLESFEESNQELLNMIKIINERKILEDSSILQSLYDLVIMTMSDKLLTDLMKHHFVEREKTN